MYIKKKINSHYRIKYKIKYIIYANWKYRAIPKCITKLYVHKTVNI